jgi:hypothetical protein
MSKGRRPQRKIRAQRRADTAEAKSPGAARPGLHEFPLASARHVAGKIHRTPQLPEHRIHLNARILNRRRDLPLLDGLAKTFC